MTMTAIERWRDWLGEPVNNAGLEIFRILFGVMAFVGVVRFAAYGWIDALYVAPKFHFKYWGFAWVQAWPAWGMYLHFVLMGCAALGIVLGWKTRLSALAYFVLFTYVELIDETTYLNHYYFVSLMSVWVALTGLGRRWSVDAWRHPEWGRTWAPRWAWCVVRAQIAVVYFFAGVAKLEADWLFRAQPLRIWLLARSELPVVGPWLERAWLAHVMSWAGMLFDLTIVGWLLWARTRALAYLAVVGFHVITWWLFPIGMFPWIMMGAATVFFAPAWPERWLGTGARRGEGWGSAPPQRAWMWFGVVWFVVQVAMPLRHWAYPGSALWTDEGFRWSWKVMLVEKTGSVRLRAVALEDGRTWEISPSEDLTLQQETQMSWQPGMILEYAHHVARRFEAKGIKVAVYADAWVSLNGRPMRRFVNPEVDLVQQVEGLGVRTWVYR